MNMTQIVTSGLATLTEVGILAGDVETHEGVPGEIGRRIAEHARRGLLPVIGGTFAAEALGAQAFVRRGPLLTYITQFAPKLARTRAGAWAMSDAQAIIT